MPTTSPGWPAAPGRGPAPEFGEPPGEFLSWLDEQGEGPDQPGPGVRPGVRPGGLTAWLRRASVMLPMSIALACVTAVWVLGCVWSFAEQTAFAHAKGFTDPALLPLVLDGLAAAMGGVAFAASLDARPAIPARVAMALAVLGSAASNGTWAAERSAGPSGVDLATVAVGVAIPIAANVALEVLLAELRRRVQRRRGLPAPAALPSLRLARLLLGGWPVFLAWRREVLAVTAPTSSARRQHRPTDPAATPAPATTPAPTTPAPTTPAPTTPAPATPAPASTEPASTEAARLAALGEHTGADSWTARAAGSDDDGDDTGRDGPGDLAAGADTLGDGDDLDSLGGGDSGRGDLAGQAGDPAGLTAAEQAALRRVAEQHGLTDSIDELSAAMQVARANGRVGSRNALRAALGLRGIRVGSDKAGALKTAVASLEQRPGGLVEASRAA